MTARTKKNKTSSTLVRYITGINIYEFVNKVHNILYKMEGAGGIDAVKRVLPIIGYIIGEARKRGGTEDAVKQVVNEMLKDIRRTKYEKILPFIRTKLIPYIDDISVKKFLEDIAKTIEGLGTTSLEKILKVIADNPDIRKAFIRYDILGALFEKMVYEAFKGGAGRYLTHRNLVITMREIAWAQFEAEHFDPINIKVYDPCAGSARFLTFWLEKILKNYPEYNNPDKLKKYAEKHLFATDKFEEMVGIAAVNMMVMGNGVANIFRADATNYFGPIIDLRNTVKFLRTFKSNWDEVKLRMKSIKPLLVENLENAEDRVYEFHEKLCRGLENKIIEIDVASEEFLAFTNFIYHLKDTDIALKMLDGLKELTKLIELPPIALLMKNMWSKRNKDVKNGFDLILTNPPMGRAGRGRNKKELLIDDKYILAQYTLAQNIWVYDIPKKKLRELAKKIGTSADPEKIVNKLGKEWITPEDYGNYRYKLVLKDSDLRWSYTIYYDRNLDPILFHDKLPIQVILLEQFLRIVRLGGKVFTVIDVGVLNNPGDEWIRRLLFTAKHIPVKAKLKAVIELPHGAFRYTGAGTKTALLFYERVNEIPENYEFFVALAEYIGYDTHKQSAEPIKENDLPLIIAEYLKWIGKKPKYYEKCKEEWIKERTCNWWIQEFEILGG